MLAEANLVYIEYDYSMKWRRNLIVRFAFQNFMIPPRLTKEYFIETELKLFPVYSYNLILFCISFLIQPFPINSKINLRLVFNQ